MTYEVNKLAKGEHPPLLAEIPEPPTELWSAVMLPPPELKLLAVVGSRKNTHYGREACEYLIAGLKDYPIGIVSGLALGIDGIAHQAALRAGLYTCAIPGSGLDPAVLHPRSHYQLAERIVQSGGGLLSEYAPDFPAALWTFPQRNRIMAGMSHATLLIEANEKSGTLITARLASDYNRDLLVVPGSIFSPSSRGTHQFMKLGATPATTPEDVLIALGFEMNAEESAQEEFDFSGLSPEEVKIIEILSEPRDRETLIGELELPISTANILLMKMELAGLIVDSPGGIRRA